MRSLSFILIMLTALPLMAEDSATTQSIPAESPTTDSATQTSASQEESASPRAAAKRLWASVAAEDVQSVRALISSADAQEAELADALAELLVAGQALSSSARQKFGDSAGSIAGQMVDPRDPSVIDRAQLVMKSPDVATLEVEGSIRPLTLTRNLTGQWQLSLNDYLQARKDAPDGAKAEDILPRQTRLLERTASVLHDGADRIRSGAFASVKDADAEIQRKLHEVMIEHNQPVSTQPAAASRADK